MFRLSGRKLLVGTICVLLIISTVVVLISAVNTLSNLSMTEDALRVAEATFLYGAFIWILYSASVSGWSEYCAHRPPAQFILDTRKLYCGAPRGKLLILVPSYKEQRETIWQTLVSAGLAEHPDRDIVLLIDDPALPLDASAYHLLVEAQLVPKRLHFLFAEAAEGLIAAEAAFRVRRANGQLSVERECKELSALYVFAAVWLERQSELVGMRADLLSHTDRLFCSEILLKPAKMHRAHAHKLLTSALTQVEIAAEYSRLSSLFRANFTSFERKQFLNLSHEPNKAMNLNAYLSLLGGAFRVRGKAEGNVLEKCEPTNATLIVPEYRYVLSVDADSLITCDYNLRLVEFMDRPENARVAIAQSPYTSIPGAASAIEHAASASTDAQFFQHQGLASLNAATWVGASALMRVKALRDIAVQRMERGCVVKVFINDTILIEDAAATVDLLSKGWTVHHDRNRLSYSATPPDFGSLVIQRRRWANGGLLILPKLLRYVLARPFSLERLKQFGLRLPNLTSAATNGAIFTSFLLIPFEDELFPPALSAALLPSLCLTGLQLRFGGYRWSDLFAVQALSVLLVPINIAGTIQSLQQALSGKAVPFARTPKINGRTRAPKTYVLAAVGLASYAAAAGIYDLFGGRLSHAAFSIFNASFLIYAIVQYIGLRNFLQDVGLLPIHGETESAPLAPAE